MFKPAAISGQSTSQRAAVNKLLESDQNKVKMSEEKLSGVWDRCIADAAVKTGTGDNIIAFIFIVSFFDKSLDFFVCYL